MHIGVLGGTGPAGQGLALRLASVGSTVTVGSRSQERAAEICAKLCGQWPDRDLPISPGDNAAAARGRPGRGGHAVGGGGADRRPRSAEALAGKVVVSMANALTRVGNEFVPLIPPRGRWPPGSRPQCPAPWWRPPSTTCPARELADLDHDLARDVLVCSDHPTATAAVSELIDQLPGLRPLDAGRLASASAIEALTPVLLQINARYKTRASIRLTDIDL